MGSPQKLMLAPSLSPAARHVLVSPAVRCAPLELAIAIGPAELADFAARHK